MRTMPACSLFAIRCGGWRRDGEQPPAQHQRLRAEMVGEKTEMPNANEAFRQYMEKESAQELSRIERHGFLGIAVCVVLPLKADSLSVEGNRAVIRNGDAMGIAAEIPQHLHWAAERSFGIDHPAPQIQAPEQLCKLFRIGEDGSRSVAAELAALTQPLQARNELAAEDFSQDWDRQKEIRLRR